MFYRNNMNHMTTNTNISTNYTSNNLDVNSLLNEFNMDFNRTLRLISELEKSNNGKIFIY
jgi:hypothetical protein